MGSDAFDETYEGFVPFSNGSWIGGNTAYDVSTKKTISLAGEETSVSDAFRAEMDVKVQTFIDINNLILETDYYRE